MKKSPLILIDGSSYLYRAFHALPPLTNSRGEPTGAIYGVINMIRKLLNDYQPEHIAVIFDPKGKTYRDEIYAHYKAHRPPAPDELGRQVEPLLAIIKAMGLPLLIVPGEEADDVIGTLAKEAEKHGMDVLISTGDKDMAQLVNDKVTLVNTMSNLVLDINGVKEKFGVKPEQIIDYLALMGDTSDNIPGVPKVGPKTAVKWLEEYGSLDEITKNAGKFTGKVGENLRASLEQLPLSKKLVTIRCDLPLNVHPNDLVVKAKDKTALTEWFQRLEFRNWLNELLQAGEPIVAKEKHYEIIFEKERFLNLLQELKQAKIFAFDTETTDLVHIDAEVVGISFALQPDQAFYIPIGHDYPGAPEQLAKDFVLAELKKLFTNPDITVIGQNVKYDFSVLCKYGIPTPANIFDTMLESYVLNSSANRHNMDTLAAKYLGIKTIEFEELAGKGEKQLTFNQITLDKAAPYACQDAAVTLQLHQILYPKLDNKLKKVFSEIEIPLVAVLSRVECTGVFVDENKLKELSYEFGERIKSLQDKAYQLANKVFNLGSPKQLQEILYQDLKIPVTKKTPTGQPSTGEEVLEELALNYPLPKVILEYRTLSKLKSTYTDALVEQINPKTGRVHTSYNQAVTTTGRLSSTDPNLQNIPIRTEEGRRIRQAFIAPKGYKIISADYSQIELRIMAHLSQDAALLAAFNQGRDIHTATAAEIFSIPLEQVSFEQRRGAKAINFGLIYGMSSFGLSRALGTEVGVAQQYMNLYFERYPNVKKYMDDTRNLAHQQGFVETIMGRRLYLPEINVSNMGRRRAAERAAINAPMQGTAADIIKLAMIHIDQWIPQSNLDIKMIMQVHDELVFEVAEKDIDKAVSAIREHMSQVMALAVPLLVEIGVGDNWDAAH